MYLDFTLYFCMTSFVNPYLKKENHKPLNRYSILLVFVVNLDK